MEFLADPNVRIAIPALTGLELFTGISKSEIMQNEEQISNPLNESLPYLAWIIALMGMVGSLFFSEVMNLPPCVLCWYQRIAMYPLVLIIGIGIISCDGRLKSYSLPFCLIGLAISVYHNLLYYGLIPESITPCTEGIPCSAKQIEWLGFITIPLMTLAAFMFMSLCLLIYKPKEK